MELRLDIREKEKRVGKTWADRLLYAGAFCGCFGAYLMFARGPAANEKQQLFRLALSSLGLVLVIIGIIMKAAGGRGGAP